MQSLKWALPAALALARAALSQDVSGSTKFQSSSKRGLIYIPTTEHPSDAQIWVENGSDLTWYYNYAEDPSAAYSNRSQEDFEYVPMLWGSSNSSGFASDIKAQLAGGRNISHILTFNEPDGSSSSGGSDIEPSAAASIWIADIEPLRTENIKIGAPAVTGSQSGLTWLSKFFSSCTSQGTNCTVDFIPLHWYGNFEGLASYIGQVVEAYPNTSIWITEYALADADLSDTVSFFQTSAEYFDRIDYIERYSYFGAFQSSVSNVGPNAVMLTQDGLLTDIGSWSSVFVTTEKSFSRSEEHSGHDIYSVENPFSTPQDQRSIISSAHQSYSVFTESKPLRQRKFKSARLIGDYDKPWTAKKDPRMIWDKIFFIGLTIVGLGIGSYIIYSGWQSVENPPYCLIFEDDFSNGINENDWNYEIEVGGYGVGSFEWTTSDSTNAYTDESGLHIVPTITTNTTDITTAELFNGYTLNLTSQGICSSTEAGDCVKVSNSTLQKMINPVRSARITTQGKHNITYGKVEVTAKLPRGDWLWPAIWMMPESNAYGAWPASGEIDIMEAKGNDGETYAGGRNEVSGTLHWAPVSTLDAYWRTSGVKYMTRGDYSDSYHTFGMEWSDSYIYTWVDSRLAQSMYIPFGKKYGTMYDRGKFSTMSVNGSIPIDPWSGTGRYNTPFDQAFYLILNVAVGATNGYFEDGYRNKPWIDSSATAMEQFYNSSYAWESTWGEGDARGLSVKSVKLYQRGVCSA
ncbi:hypothetical protein UA08_07422 [Talaromyces atroroseus]|uniref:GH16 domain-containing protein n=1 Tax=Talaromyces atroroseus TaxID=1441469 RepID=A0A225AQP9_TALAT|nr:hypothetical protein UA08_07422 [Talaromyces atroroseus]OKL57256.1 hypothetical protein UA08_07422 [Talaromyces atroroseus]